MSIHLPAELEARIEREASGQGKNPEQWLVERIEGWLDEPEAASHVGPMDPAKDARHRRAVELRQRLTEQGYLPIQSREELYRHALTKEEGADVDVDAFLEVIRDLRRERRSRIPDFASTAADREQ